VDLRTVFDDLDAERCFNVIDYLVVTDALANTKSQGALKEVRTALDKLYDRIEGVGSVAKYSPPIVYADQTEDGYVGFEKPLG
jgi:hypothetical protein